MKKDEVAELLKLAIEESYCELNEKFDEINGVSLYKKVNKINPDLLEKNINNIIELLEN